MHSRIIYTTDWTDQTVTIDYNQTLRQFLSDKEHHPFSAERIVRMLNSWAKINKIDIPRVGHLHIAANGAHCVLTQQALNSLSQHYRQHPDWQIEYPFVSGVLIGHCSKEGNAYGTSFTQEAARRVV